MKPLNLRDQIIWCNKNVRSQGKTLFFPQWIKEGIIYVKDLFTDGFLSTDNHPTLCNRPSTLIERISLYQKKIWKMLGTTSCKETQIAELNYKLLHQILPCSEKLNKWKIQDEVGQVINPRCILCDSGHVVNYKHYVSGM
ncbi:uncharacterized protein LOC144877113 [Branchiostoma floridae x Branchiostoma japonicum]